MLRPWFLIVLILVALPAVAQPPVDNAWTTSSYWDDGLSEIAFYELSRSRDQYGRSRSQTILVGTYLVKHGFDPVAQSKASGSAGVQGFKSAFFYEFESGAYQYKRSWVANLSQDGLRPLKMSFNSFDWCSNRYEELAFLPSGEVASLIRSDDYGNAQATHRPPAGAYPAAAVPLLVRGLDLSRGPARFAILTADGKLSQVSAELAGREALELAGGEREAEKVVVRYEGTPPSIFGERAEAVETWWRGTGPGRLLLRLESESGRYQLELVEELRSAYWREDFYSRLERIRERP